MLANSECQHRFCTSCMQKHVESQVHSRRYPTCPDPNCRGMHHIVEQIVKEISIPASEKVYCPNPTCSHLTSKAELMQSSLSYTRCVNCAHLFCRDCKVLWHWNTTCEKWKPDPGSADGKLNELAGTNKWRQCPMCSHMVELALGCNHIYCRRGHEFCYVCGFEWKNKKPTCTCQLWTEANIIRR